MRWVVPFGGWCEGIVVMLIKRSADVTWWTCMVEKEWVVGWTVVIG